MMMMKKQPNSLAQRNNPAPTGATTQGLEWEMRPGGMLVQKRNIDPSSNNQRNAYNSITPTIRVIVKFNSSYHDIQINPHSSFGELKKMLTGPTGLHPQDQKLTFKDKERDSKNYLDIVGVKDGSRICLTVDVLSQEKRLLELRRNNAASATGNEDRALKSVAEVSAEIDKLAIEVTKLDGVIARGGMVSEKELLSLIEMLMSQLIKLDGIEAEGNTKLTRKKQVVRVQGYIETLDRLKARNEIARLLQQQQQKKMLSSAMSIAAEENQVHQKGSRHHDYHNDTHYGHHHQMHMRGGGQVRTPQNFAPQQAAVTTTQWEKF